MSDMNPGITDPTPNRKNIIVNCLLAICVIGAIGWGISTYFDLGREAYTDDAQVQEYINPVNVRIPGYIKKVRFEEHQFVKKGDTLVTIDDREYHIALEQAEASYSAAIAAKNVTSSTRTTTESNIGITEANIAASKARLWNARQNYIRYQSLLKDSAATQQQFDQVKTEYDALAAQTLALQKQRNTTTLSTNEVGTRITVNDADIKRAEAAVDLARLNLSYTVITAPYDGYTGRRNVEEGQLVQAGQNLLAFVRNNDKWVVANFRETQIGKIHIGDNVKITIDGFNDKILVGKVTAVSEATGASYSAIPVDNSTGNFVKVQQRIPVKIRLAANENKKDDIELLKAGMNVEVRLNKN
ncbi:HlyD family secretion protein [Mucilaginibacter kameinonensis]|uniref:HlyD family secretion protein n=1 Tax=Mucilaginibacter kameinonensis TaxID=452286 RepID=UPI001ABF1D3D|nr:HlyD family secretion protein [Mucilaginibacter kameinonensis]